MNKKILIAGVIAVAFLLTVSFVGGDVDKESASAEVDPSDVASIGDTSYATLESAIGSSNANDTITLLNDYTTISKITIDKDLTIDLNDKTLTLGDALELTDGTVVIKDGSIASSLSTAVTVTGESELTSENVVVSVEFEAYHVRGGSTDTSSSTHGYEPSLTIIGGSVTSAKDCCVFIYGISSLEIEGDASLESRGMYATIQGNGNATSGGTTVKLGACSVINTYVVEQGEPSVSAIYVPQAVTFDIDGATIEGGTGLYIKSGTYTIKNASITGTAHHRGYEYYNNGAKGTGDAIVIDTCGYPGGNPAVSIQSGTYSSVYASSVGSYAYGDGNSILTGFITGGTFTDATCILYMSNTARITINGDCTLSDNATVPAGAELSIASNKTLTVASGKTLIVNGTLTVQGTLVGDATGNISCPVSFNSNGGSSVSSTTSSYNGLVTQPTSPTKSGYNFAGWYKESGLINAWDFSTDVVSGGTVLYAKWTVNQYTITFDTAGGSAVPAITQDYGTAITSPAAPTKTGYTFDEWSPALPNTMPAENILITAQWNIITYDELPVFGVISDIISQDDEPVLQVKGNAADQVLENTIFQSIGDKPFTVDVVDDEGQVQYSWTFEGDYKSEAGTFKAGISEVTPEGDLSGAITSTGAENPLVLNFAASGELPINATVKYYVGDKYENGTKLTLFFYNETTKQLEEKAKDLVVTDGWVTLSLTHCSSYVLAEPAPASTPEDSTMLYIGIGAAAAAILGAVAFFIIRRR